MSLAQVGVARSLPVPAEPTPPGIVLSLTTQVIDATYLEKYVTHFQLRIATFASS